MVLSNQLYVELLKMTSRGPFQPHLVCDSCLQIPNTVVFINTYTWEKSAESKLICITFDYKNSKI